MRHLAFAFAFFSCAQIAAGQEQETSRENQPTPALEPVTDRETGEFLVGTPYAKQTWAEGLDEKGRPIRRDGKLPTPEGNVVSPSMGGGTNWWSAAYSPRTELYYVNAYDGEQEFFHPRAGISRGRAVHRRWRAIRETRDSYKSASRALDPRTGDLRWEFEIKPRSTSGLLATAGDLVFGGTVDGYFFALDAANGEELWHIAAGARVHSAPLTYSVNGEQFVTVAAGKARGASNIQIYERRATQPSDASAS